MADKAPPVDVLRPWTIKSVVSRVIDNTGKQAPRMGLTQGQLIEKMHDKFFLEGGGDERVDVVAAVATLLEAAGPFGKDNPIPREVRTLINDYARIARGLPGKPRQTEDARIGHTGSTTEDDQAEPS